MGAFSDNLDYNREALKSQIGNLTESKQTMGKLKEGFIGLVDNLLQPNWKTPNGELSVKNLKDFANSDIHQFIEYTNARISDLEQAATNLGIIDEA